MPDPFNTELPPWAVPTVNPEQPIPPWAAPQQAVQTPAELPVQLSHVMPDGSTMPGATHPADQTALPQGIGSARFRVAEQGYAPPTKPDRDPLAPLQRAEQEVRQSTEQQAQNVERLGQAKAGYEQNVTKYALDKKQELLDDVERDRADLATTFETERVAQQAKIDQAIAEIPKRDPKRWWKNLSGFQKGMSYLSAAIDGFLNPHGENGAVGLAVKLAEQDSYAQMTDIDTAKAKAGYAQNAYERLIGDQAHRQQQFLEQKAYRLESLAVAVEQRGLTFKSPITQMEHKLQADAIRQEGAKTLATLANAQSDALNAAANRALQERMQKREIAAQLTAAKLKAEGEMDKTSAVTTGNPAVPGDKFYIDPEIAKGLGRYELQKIRDPEKGIAGYSKFAEDMRELVQLQEEIGRKYGGPGGSTKAYIGSEEYQRAKQLYQQISSPERHRLYGAALTENEQKNFKEMLPEPETWTSLKSRDNYREALRAKNRDAQQAFGNQYGLHRRNADGTAQVVDLEKEWAPLPARETDKPFNPIQSIHETRRGISNGAVAPGDDTLKKNIEDIKEAAKMVGRGQQIVTSGGPDGEPVPNDVAVEELTNQGTALVADLVKAGRVAEANQVQTEITKLRQAAESQSRKQTEAGYGPVVGQEQTAVPPWYKRRGSQTQVGE